MMQNITKRLVALSVVCVFLSLAAVAQVGERRSELAFGFNAGVALNKITFEPTIKQRYHVGPTMGLTLRYTCEKYFKTVCALQVELNYTRLGWTENIINAANEPLPDTYTRDQNYLQLPLLARLAWGREVKGFMGYLLLGPQVGYCINEKEKRSEQWTLNGEGNPDRPNNLYAQYSMPIENKFDYGITAGLGCELHTKLGHFMLDGRYYFALSDIYGNSKRDVFARSAHGTILAKITYLFNLRSDKTPRK